MYFELIKKAADCRKAALRCKNQGQHGFAHSWTKLGKGFVASARSARAVFMNLDDQSLPG